MSIRQLTPLKPRVETPVTPPPAPGDLEMEIAADGGLHNRFRKMKIELERMNARSDEENERDIRNALAYISGLPKAAARDFVTRTFNSEFFKTEKDTTFKILLARELYAYCAKVLHWENAFLKSKAQGK